MTLWYSSLDYHIFLMISNCWFLNSLSKCFFTFLAHFSVNSSVSPTLFILLFFGHFKQSLNVKIDILRVVINSCPYIFTLSRTKIWHFRSPKKEDFLEFCNFRVFHLYLEFLNALVVTVTIKCDSAKILIKYKLVFENNL